MLNFSKYSASGNDFVLLDGTKDKLYFTAPAIVELCDRHFGIGADGVVILKNWDDADKILSIELYNSDGSTASMCANGTRCAAHFALSKKIVPAKLTSFKLKTKSGLYLCHIKSDSVILEMPSLFMKKMQVQLFDLPFDYEKSFFANTGVPHSVFLIKTVADIPIAQWGAQVRNDPAFSEGSNVNFVTAYDLSKNIFQVRTFERGVEAETLSCGTGLLATTWALYEWFGLEKEIKFITPGGELKASYLKEFISYGGKVTECFQGSKN